MVLCAARPFLLRACAVHVALLVSLLGSRANTSLDLRGGRSVLEHGSQVQKRCSLALKSEPKLEESAKAPRGLAESVVQGKWTYQQTNQGVKKHTDLSSDSGQFDLWVEKAIPSDSQGGSFSEVSTLIYVTSQTESTEGFVGSITIRGEGYYDADSGMLCLLGCLDDERASFGTTEFKRSPAGDAFDPFDSPPLEQRPAMDLRKEFGEGTVLETAAGGDDQVCHMRLLLRFRLTKGVKSEEAEVQGRLESLRKPGEASFFSPVVISASTGAISNQVLWFQIEMAFEAVLCAVQAACIVVQIMHTRKDHEGCYVSLTMILVQMFVYAIYWARSLIYPLRYLNSEILFYFLSDVANLPRFVEFLIFMMYVYLAVLVDTKRRKATRRKPATPCTESPSGEGAETTALVSSGFSTLLAGGRFQPGISERQLAFLFWPAYAGTGLWMWYSYDFDMFLRGSTFLFLLPQCLAFYAWNPPESALKAVHLGYAVGNTIAQMFWLAFEVMRPRLMGYDAYFSFPHAWYWSSTLLMMLQVGFLIGQRLAGPRFINSGLRFSHPSKGSSSETDPIPHRVPPKTLTGMVQP